MFVWTVANQKGGVGKTTTTVSVAGLCAEQKKRVLLLDLDPHGSLSSYFKVDAESGAGSTFTLFQQRKELSRAKVYESIHATGIENISIVPASMALATLERQAIGSDGMGLVVSEALNHVKADFDVVLIDCPPLLGVLMINALAACQHLILPVQTEHLAIKGLERMLQTLTMMARSRPVPLSYTIVPTMFDRRTQASVQALRELKNTYPDDTWPGKIPIDTKLRDASKAGIPPNFYAPGSRSVEAYRSMLKWLLKQIVMKRKQSAAALAQ